MTVSEIKNGVESRCQDGAWAVPHTCHITHMKECCMVGQHADSAAGYCASKARSRSENIVIHLHVFNSQAYPNRNKTADAQERTFHSHVSHDGRRAAHMKKAVSTSFMNKNHSWLMWWSIRRTSIYPNCAVFQQLTCLKKSLQNCTERTNMKQPDCKRWTVIERGNAAHTNE